MDARLPAPRGWSIRTARSVEDAVERARALASAWAGGLPALVAPAPGGGGNPSWRPRKVDLRLEDDSSDAVVYALVALEAEALVEYERADGKRLTGLQTTVYPAGTSLGRLTAWSDPAGSVLELGSVAESSAPFAGLDLEGLADLLRSGLAAAGEADPVPLEAEPRRAGAGSRAFVDRDDFLEKMVDLIVDVWLKSHRRPTQPVVGRALVTVDWYDYRGKDGEDGAVDDRQIRTWCYRYMVTWDDLMAEAERRYRLRRTSGKPPV